MSDALKMRAAPTYTVAWQLEVYLLRLYLPEGTGNGLLILKPLREAGIGDLTVSDLKHGLVMFLILPAVVGCLRI